ncbi:importin 9 [Trifolium pratense]|uniref:Importin 9 n=1 Tax=Trifolium pratense TaxID=57577 RepID=A0A2K3LMR8_TRIPR|nr:importin 9 [Trifolium pratense]
MANKEDSLEYPFLYAHIFSSVAKFSSVISNEVLENSLDAALKAITMNVCLQGTCQLLPKAKKEIVQPQLFGLFAYGFQESDETLHMEGEIKKWWMGLETINWRGICNASCWCTSTALPLPFLGGF